MLKKVLNFLQMSFKKTPLTTSVVEIPIVNLTEDPPNPGEVKPIEEEKKKRGRKKKEENIQ
jgi:hypothetical protein